MINLSAENIESVLSDIFKDRVFVRSFLRASGGCINNTYSIESSHGKFFLKLNDLKSYPGMFEAEKKGLQFLRNASPCFIPKVFSSGSINTLSYLLIEYIPRGNITSSFWVVFGESLAKLHRNTNELYGLDHDNYIGSLPQSNKQHKSWTEFFILERLEPQLKLAKDERKISSDLSAQFKRLFNRLENIFPLEKPALLHGDLWSGNFMCTSEGKPCIFDPAVYYGHREIEIAMTKLFGDFDKEFYEAYISQYPLEKGWEERLDICNLYPLMVHVNLFGGGYLSQVANILRKF